MTSKEEVAFIRAVTENSYKVAKECLGAKMDDIEEDIVACLLVHTGDIHFAKKSLRKWRSTQNKITEIRRALLVS